MFKNQLFFIFTLLLFVSPAQAGTIYESNGVLSFTIRTNFNEIVINKFANEKRSFPAIFTDAVGKQIVGTVASRGNSRFQACKFPPLKVKFTERQKDGIFNSVKAFKLVTHCRPGAAGTKVDPGVLIKEAMIYQMYQRITLLSFRIRLAQITYIDDQGIFPTTKELAFLIEDKGEVAKRTGLLEVEDTEARKLSPKLLDIASVRRVQGFQYFILNKDWYFMNGGKIELKNTEMLKDRNGKIYLLPYDFDLSSYYYARFEWYGDKVFNNSRDGLRYLRDKNFTDPSFQPFFQTVLMQRKLIDGTLLQYSNVLPRNYVDTLLKYNQTFYEVISEKK